MSEENNKSNFELNREELNDSLTKLLNELDNLTEDINLPDDVPNVLCYSPTASIKLFERLKGNNKNGDDDNCPSSSSNDNHDDNSDTQKKNNVLIERS